jgi:hypothetical protein
VAIKTQLSRNVTWICRTCGGTNIKPSGATNQTTGPAEQHADQEGHQVIAIGQIMYGIAPGSTPDDDPFSSDSRR